MGTIKTSSGGGKLVQNLATAIKSAQREQVSSRYSIFLNERPTFTTYYAQDMTKSTTDHNLGGSVEFVGGESGIRYNKLEDFPLYGMPTFNFEKEITDFGQLANEITGEVNVLPGTIIPKENDVFVLEEYRNIALAKISKVTPAHMEGKTYFRLTFFLTSHVSDIEQQVEDSFETDFDSIGVIGASIFLRKSLHQTREYLDTVTGYLKNVYRQRFFSEQASMFMLPPAGSSALKFGSAYSLVDYGLNTFIDTSKFFRANRGYHKNYTAVFQDRGYDSNLLDFNSPYVAFSDLATVKSMLANAGNYIVYSLQQPKEGDTLFYTLRGKKIYVPWMITSELVDSVVNGTWPESCYVQLFPDGYYDFIINGTMPDEEALSGLSPIQVVILRYFSGGYSDKDKSLDANIELFISDVNNSSMFIDSLAFWLLPFIFLVSDALKQEIDNHL